MKIVFFLNLTHLGAWWAHIGSILAFPGPAQDPPPGHPQSSKNFRKHVVFEGFFAVQLFRQDAPKMLPKPETAGNGKRK